MSYLKTEVVIPAPVDEVFDYCTSTAGFVEQFPYRVRWDGGPERWSDGDTLSFRYRVGGVWLRHDAKIVELTAGKGFTDRMTHGFYRSFVHVHRFEPVEHGTRVIDEVHAVAPGGRLAEAFGAQRMLRRTFAKRHAALRAAFEKKSTEARDGS
jgi:ligand-binding SRPBCC domain-containing protein